MDEGAIAARAAMWMAKDRVDPPEHVGLDVYEEAERSYAEALEPLGRRAQLYRYGVWHTLGISDLDMLCVVDDDIDTEALRRIETAPRSPLMVHPPLVLPRSIASWFRWFLPITDLFPVGDPEAKLAIREPDPREFADLCMISAFNTSLMAWRGFVLAHDKPELPVRGSMLRLWTVRHTIKFSELAGVAPTPEWQAFADETAEMRAAFRDGRDVDVAQLARCLARAEPIAREVAESTAAERLARSNAPEFDARSLQGGHVRVDVGGRPWRLRAHQFGRRRIPYIRASLPRDVAAFVAQAGGTSPFDETLRKARALGDERTGFIEKHDIYGLWSGKQFLGRNARHLTARIRDRLALRLFSLGS